MRRRFDVVVVGGGVVGLTTAALLQQTEQSVCVLSADPPERTTSYLAAAVWYPTGFSEHPNVLRWARRSFEVFSELAEDPHSGVLMRESIMLLRRPAGRPWWAKAVGRVARMDPQELSPPFVDGYRFVVPLVEMPIYLPWLLREFVRSGGVFEQRAVRSLQEAASYGEIVLNCSGLRARTLCGDETLVPVRGDVVRVVNPGLRVSVRDEENPKGRTYVHPRTHDCILGGTSEPGEWDTSPDPAKAAAIVERCVELAPELEGSEVLEHHVGLRPSRPDGVRLELDTAVPSGSRLIHNYGHGGAGITLSWGCAEEAVVLAKRALQPEIRGARPSEAW